MVLKISDIIIDGGTQPRAACEASRVDEYASDMSVVYLKGYTVKGIPLIYTLMGIGGD